MNIKKKEVEYVDIINYYPQEQVLLGKCLLEDQCAPCILKTKRMNNNVTKYFLAKFVNFEWRNLEKSGPSIIGKETGWQLLGYWRISRLFE